jgi:sulfate/thiosulfate transport system substrate-binding protein
MNFKLKRTQTLILTVLVLLVTGCSGASTQDANSVQLTLAAYTTPREAYGEIIPLFQSYWKDKTGQTVISKNPTRLRGRNRVRWWKALRRIS